MVNTKIIANPTTMGYRLWGWLKSAHQNVVPGMVVHQTRNRFNLNDPKLQWPFSAECVSYDLVLFTVLSNSGRQAAFNRLYRKINETDCRCAMQ